MNVSLTADSEIFVEGYWRKRTHKRKLEIKQKVEEMRAALPVYNLKDIREYRLPYYEAVFLELTEEGFPHALAYIKELFELEKQQHIEVERQHGIWTRPFLIDTPVELRFLKDALVAAEKAHLRKDYAKEVEEILKAAMHFSFGPTEDWWWLGNELHIQSIQHSAIYYIGDHGKMEAWCRYAYGKFLVQLVGDFDTGECELTLARRMASGKSWSMKQFFPRVRDTLYMHTNRLLYICAIRKAKYWIRSNTAKAAELADKARKRAREACHHEGETEALLLKGYCYLNSNDHKKAISNYSKAYYIQANLRCAVGMCEARVHLSKAYLLHGTSRQALENLTHLKETAQNNDLPFYVAQAYRHLGIYYLHKGIPDKATPLFTHALELLYHQNNVEESEHVRNLQAISAGMELMPGYIGLIKSTGEEYDNYFENFMTLVRWKATREQFWKTDSKGSICSTWDRKVEVKSSLDAMLRHRSVLISIYDMELDSERNETMSVLNIGSRKSVVGVKSYDSDISRFFHDEYKASLKSESKLIRQPTNVQLKAENIIKDYVKQIDEAEKTRKRRVTNVYAAAP